MIEVVRGDPRQPRRQLERRGMAELEVGHVFQFGELLRHRPAMSLAMACGTADAGGAVEDAPVIVRPVVHSLRTSSRGCSRNERLAVNGIQWWASALVPADIVISR